MPTKPDPALSSPASRSVVLKALRNGSDLEAATALVGSTSLAARTLAATDDDWQRSLQEACEEGDTFASNKRDEARLREKIEAEQRKAAFDALAAESAKREEEERRRAPRGRQRRTPADAAIEADGSPYLVEVPAHPLTPPRSSIIDATGATDWPRIRREALEYGPGPFGLLMWQEARLTAHGFPGMSPWWIWNLENFFASLKRWFLCLGGRGMGKSSVNTRISAICVDTDRKIPPGQTWIYPFVSVRPDDAKRRLFEIREILEVAYNIHAFNAADGKTAVDAEGMPKPLKITSPEGTPTLPLLDSRGQSIAFVSFAATLGNVSGPNSIGATADEEEKIERSTAEIIGSLIATFRARQGIRGTRISSAMTVSGSLYKDARKGHTITNYVATIGERWLADAREGCLEVARWEDEQKHDAGAADALRRHALSLTADSIMIPTWIGNTMHGEARKAAVTYRVEAEGTPEDESGMTPAAFFLREYCSRPTGLVDEDEDDGIVYDVCGVESRYDNETAKDRGYDAR